MQSTESRSIIGRGVRREATGIANATVEVVEIIEELGDYIKGAGTSLLINIHELCFCTKNKLFYKAANRKRHSRLSQVLLAKLN